MISSALRLLAANVPRWFSDLTVQDDSLRGRALVLGTPWEETGVRLTIQDLLGIAVAEERPGTAFPRCCPERHVQRDETFCLGLHKIAIVDEVLATQWWEHLRQFLSFQGVAELTRTWPFAHELAHGDAGKHHERALILADELGMAEEYAAAYLDEPSWITDPALRLLNKQREPINGRAPCPRGCRHKRRPSSPIVRRNCLKRDGMLQLVREEHARRRALETYWGEYIKMGGVCCGRMNGCRLPSATA